MRLFHLLRILRLAVILFAPTMATKTDAPETVLSADPSELNELAQLGEHLDAILNGSQTAHLVMPDGRAIELPTAAVEALHVIVNAIARGQAVTIVPQDKELTTQAAADLLRVSRPHLIKLLEAGKLPFHRVGTHRRIRIEDVLAYRKRRDQTRKIALDELAHISEELPGGYR
jgi:excisionase family DNA binding protein